MKILLTSILMVTALFMGVTLMNQPEEDGVGAVTRIFRASQMGLNPTDNYVLTLDGSTPTWEVSAGGGGSSPFTDEGAVIYTTNDESVKAAFFTATGTRGAATSTFTHRVQIGTTSANSVADLYVESENAADPALVLRETSGQTSNIFEIRDAANTILFDVESNGQVDIIHTSTGNNEEALEIDCDAAGFGDMKCLDLVFVSGAISAGEDETAFLVNIDDSASTGGDIFAKTVLTTSGSADVWGALYGAQVNPIVHLSGNFGDMDGATTTAGGDVLASFISTGSNVTMFASDNDTVTIGDAAKFEEIEFQLATAASGAGIAPTFEYSTGVGTWTTFSPIDGTNGMRNNGEIIWLDADIPSWAVGTSSQFMIRITRTQNGLATAPVEDLVQISAVTQYYWNKNASLHFNEATTTDMVVSNQLLVGNQAGVTTNQDHALQILGTGADDSGATLGRFSANAQGSHLDFLKSRNATIGSNTIVNDNDVVGLMQYYPDDGVDYATLAARFKTEVDDASPAAGDVGMAFVWDSMAGGAAAIAEKMRLDAAGNLTLAGTVDGVDIAARDHDSVTLAGTPDYLTLSGQAITRTKLDLPDDINTFTEAQLETAVSDDNPVFDGDIGSNVQAWDAELDTLAGLAETNGNVIFAAGGAWTSDATPAIDCSDCTNISGLWEQYNANGIRQTDTTDQVVIGGSATTTTDLELEVNGDIGITFALEHIGDPNTFLSFLEDQFAYTVGGVNMLSLTEGSQDTFTIAEAGVDIDFRIETADDTHALFFQGSNGHLGLGTTSPEATLDVWGDNSGTILTLFSNAGTKFMEMLNTGVTVLLGAWDFGGATSLEIPNGAAPTVDADGETAIDTTNGQLVYYSDVKRVLVATSSKSFNIASTTVDGIGNNWGTATATYHLGNFPYPITLHAFHCTATSSGQGTMRFIDGSGNATNGGACAGGARITTTSNNTFTAFEDFQVEIGSHTSGADRITGTIEYTYTAE